MEDLYSELDNYNDVNAIQELRTENMELKVKLEEHATAMEKLQKEYDNLEMEFKKLENNYSSLLKTARAEIERKTQLITQLNTEKDLMVLDSLQNGKRIRTKFNKGVQNKNMASNEKFTKGNGNKELNENRPKVKSADSRSEGCELPSMQAKETLSCPDVDNRSKVNKSEPKADSFNKRKSNVKEIPKTEYKDMPNIHASSIKNRRKSTPAVSTPFEKFSSDEECENYYPTKDARTDIRSTNKFERRTSNKVPFDRHSNKTSETSSVDDKGFNYHESTSREAYRGRTSRHYDNAYRGKDKYEVSLKYRKHYSPDREQRRKPRDYQDEYHRQDHGRYVPPENLPQEPYYRHQRRNIDTRSNYDRHSRDYDKYSHHYEEKYPIKHRLSNDYNESHPKRQKTNSFNNPDTYYTEDKKYYNDKDMETHIIPEFSPHECDMQRFSCQSPDYVYTDASFANPVKEIMATAATPLEDPRVTSNKYVLEKENGKETLSTSVGRNIDMKSVDKSLWNFKTVAIPVALTRRPSQCNEEMINIYMDIDNPISNLSMESGEIFCDSDTEKIESSKNRALSVIGHPNNIQHPGSVSKQDKSAESVPKTFISKYRIPKIGLNKKDQSRVEKQSKVVEIDTGENKILKKNNNEKISASDSWKKSLHKQHDNEHDNILSISTHVKGKEQIATSIARANMAIVADDLELSDDNSDNIDTNRQTTTKVTDVDKKHCNLRSNINKTKKEDTANNVGSEARNRSSNDKRDIAVENVDIKSLNVVEKAKEDKKSIVEEKVDDQAVVDKKANEDKKIDEKTKVDKETVVDEKAKAVEKTIVDEKVKAVEKTIVDEKANGDEKSKESDSAKKQKGKKKKSKTSTKDLGENSEAVQVTEKKTRSKKEVSKPKEINNKFSDLFGDSNSLMTPEDLGIASYVPICEDAQDAVDLKINEIIDASPPLSNNKEGLVIKIIAESKNREENKHDDKTENPLEKTNTEVIEATKDSKTKTFKKKEENTVCNEISPINVVDVNLEPAINSKELDVAKTIIISTGIQPQLSSENRIEDNSVIQVSNVAPIPTIAEFAKQDLMKALATSTPQKEYSTMNTKESDSSVTTFTCASNALNIKAIDNNDNASQVADQSNTNTLDSHDAPDVRIFVKRRRKILKRPPMT